MLLALVLAACGGDDGPTSPDDPGFEGSLYRAIKVDGGITWEDARAGAESIGPGWHLVVISSAAENAIVYDLVDDDAGFWTEIGGGPNHEGPWLGGRKIGPGVGDYEWVNEEPFDYQNWAPLEPFGNGDRLGLFGFNAPTGPQWNDVPSTRLVAGYVAECTGCVS